MNFDLFFELDNEFFLAMINETDVFCAGLRMSDVAFPAHFEADLMYCAYSL